MDDVFAFGILADDATEVREFFDQELLDFFSRLDGIHVKTGHGVFI